MKKNIHPKYYTDAKVTCVCGNSFVTGSTLPEIKTEICSACHPFYTGKQKLVDTSRRVDKFQKRAAQAIDMSAVRKGKKVKQAARAAKRAKGEVTVKTRKKDKK
ncbi:50S ribosomal protein L31 [Candidatus Falkowbacteria bacterium CG10_big_fil_rev_8_21_14_0_10_43_11]|uniref:Large ribosomal subunit protein bL31 n=1 Tax=Candidatus Falkowbacteria bacterium CG10_big_fil_rev_8_21_14_0_10_43_11 TaxID=1974568 RepID=A0A2M6WKY1_9BACT|nr:MAG: 50S ribosomal protein L31 [Candidatus Falkowbacteria bacterium CG10_big_fil_rev_8_21_14_0_10_43_11]